MVIYPGQPLHTCLTSSYLKLAIRHTDGGRVQATPPVCWYSLPRGPQPARFNVLAEMSSMLTTSCMFKGDVMTYNANTGLPEYPPAHGNGKVISIDTGRDATTCIGEEFYSHYDYNSLWVRMLTRTMCWYRMVAWKIPPPPPRVSCVAMAAKGRAPCLHFLCDTT